MTSKYLIWITLLLSFFSSGAFSQSRVIEDSLVYSDPTLSKGGGWIYGGSVDYWQVNMKYKPISGSYTGNLDYGQPGISFFAGKGNITGLLNYKEGSGQITYPFDYSKVNTRQVQFSLRYLLDELSTTYFTPYVMASYWNYHMKSDSYYTNGTFYHSETTNASAPMIGGGVIIPFSKTFGVRVDDLYGKTNASGKSTQSTAIMGNNGNINMLTLTAYYNLTNNVNFQFGYQLSQLKPSANVNEVNRNIEGLYAKIGYTFK